MRTLILGAVLIALVTVVAYIPALSAAYIWDDNLYVTDNLTLRSLDGLRSIWLDPASSPQYYPLVFTSFWAEYHLWGTSAVGFHLVNVMLHALNAILLWIALGRLRVAGAFLAAVIFAVHPVHVASVAWVSERKDVLSCAFYLLTVLAWLRHVETRRWAPYAAALVLFICALLSKTVTCMLPAALVLLAWWQRPSEWRLALVRTLPFFAVGLALALITVWREGLDVDLVAAVPPLSLLEHVLLAGRALCFYAWKLIWPLHLTAIYPRWDINTGAAWQYVFPIGVVAVLGGLWAARGRWGSGPFVAALFFAITLAPVLGWMRFNLMRLSYVSDHLQYLASIGPIALFAAVVTTASAVLERRGYP